jgi:hypothetical protein
MEEIRQAAEKDTSGAKKPTDAVMKAQAAVKVAPYRRFRNYIRGYVSSCEKSLASLRTTVDKCNAQNYLSQKVTYRSTELQK